MNKRQNALEIMRFGRPERVTGGMPAYMLGYFGVNHESHDGTTEDCPVGTKWVDIWGIGWEKDQDGIMGYPTHFPLADMDALRTYKWPDPDDERICGRIYEQLAGHRAGADDFLTGSHRNLLFEKANKLVGMEDLMVYFYTEPEYVREIFHRIMDFQLGIQKHYLKAGVEAINCSEDLGGQTAPMIGPDVIREYMLPEYKRLLDAYKDRCIIINLHSCGNVESLVDIFVEMRIDILNPVQATANNLDNLRALTMGKIALQGGVSSATVVSGPEAAIRAEVRERILQLGRNGGYFCSIDQHMPFPEGNADIVRQAVEEYGKYPLTDEQ